MPIYETLVFGVLAPALIVGAGLLLSWLRAGANERIPAVVAPLLFAAALCTAFFLLIGTPTLPPVQAEEWMLAAVAATAGGMALLGALGARQVSATIVMAILFPASAWFLLSPGNEYLWREVPGWVVAIATAGAGFLGWLVTDLQAARERGGALPFLLMTALGLTAVALMLAGSMKFGQMGVALAAASGAVWVVALVRPTMRLTSGWTASLGVGLTMTLAAAAVYAWLPLPAAVTAGLSAAAPGISGLLRRHRPRTLPVIAVEIAIILILGGIAVYLTWQASPSLDPLLY